MVGSALANTDWSTEPKNTGSIVLIAITRLSRCESACGPIRSAGIAEAEKPASPASASCEPAVLLLRESFMKIDAARSVSRLKLMKE
jgi:hypothetical protein